MTERRYAMIRVGPGDYLLPSNDGRTLWRICSYLENGSLQEEVEPGKYRTVRGTFWTARRYVHAIGSDGSGFARAAGDLDEWSEWPEWSCLHRTRADAVNDALNARPRKH